MLWHLHQDWTLELHEGEDPNDESRMHVDCKIIAKLDPDGIDIETVIELHNLSASGQEVPPWTPFGIKEPHAT